MGWLVASLKETPINLSGGKSLCAFIFNAKPLVRSAIPDPVPKSLEYEPNRLLPKTQPTHLPDWANLGQTSGQNTVKEWSEHKINAIFELNTLEIICIDSLFNLIYEF